MSDKKHDLKGKFVVQCMNGKQQMDMSNRGHLLFVLLVQLKNGH